VLNAPRSFAGDSFILAFPTPSDALGFALAFQEGLLRIEWPGQLLAGHDICRPVWVRSSVEAIRRQLVDGHMDAVLQDELPTGRSGISDMAGPAGYSGMERTSNTSMATSAAIGRQSTGVLAVEESIMSMVRPAASAMSMTAGMLAR
jgi:hypothetical protein